MKGVEGVLAVRLLGPALKDAAAIRDVRFRAFKSVDRLLRILGAARLRSAGSMLRLDSSDELLSGGV